MGTLRLFTLLLIMLFPFSLLHSQTETKSENDYQKWRVGISGGMSYMIGNTKEAKEVMTDMGISSKLADDYYGDLKLGMMAGVDFQYFFKPKFGLGIKYLFYSNSAKTSENVSLALNGDGVSLFHGPVEEQVYVNYVGPTFSTREFLGNQKKWSMTSLLSIGYVHYRDEGVIVGVPLLQTGNTFGWHGAIGIEHNLSKNVALGLELSYMYAFLSKVKLSDGTSTQTIDLGDKKENLSRLDLGLNLKFYF